MEQLQTERTQYKKKKMTEQVIMDLKGNFKHIHGMLPKTAKFKDE